MTLLTSGGPVSSVPCDSAAGIQGQVLCFDPVLQHQYHQ